MTDLKTGGAKGYLRIATEEAFITQAVLDAYMRLNAEGFDDPGFKSLWGFYASSPSARGVQIRDGLLSLGTKRLADMDAAGIDKGIIALTAPGTHVFQADEAKALATDANDQLADACRAHPDRFIGMTAIAPADPETSIRSAFFRPVLNRLASKEPSTPSSKRAVNSARSSTVTVPRSWEAVPERPRESASSGRSATRVSRMPETEAIWCPVMNWARSMAWAPMSPRAPDPAFPLSRRQVIGASSSASQSCR